MKKVRILRELIDGEWKFHCYLPRQSDLNWAKKLVAKYPSVFRISQETEDK